MGTVRTDLGDYSCGEPKTARKDYRCDVCDGKIFKGEKYERNSYGYPERIACPDTLEERQRRGCRP